MHLVRGTELISHPRGARVLVNSSRTGARRWAFLVVSTPGRVDRRLRIGWMHTPRGGRGIELAGGSDPALVLLDLHLPDMNGIDVLHALQSDPRTAAIPVAVVSADANPHQIQLLHAAGALEYLTKPFRITELLELLDRHANPRAAGERARPCRVTVEVLVIQRMSIRW